MTGTRARYWLPGGVAHPADSASAGCVAYHGGKAGTLAIALPFNFNGIASCPTRDAEAQLNGRIAGIPLSQVPP